MDGEQTWDSNYKEDLFHRVHIAIEANLAQTELNLPDLKVIKHKYYVAFYSLEPTLAKFFSVHPYQAIFDRSFNNSFDDRETAEITADRFLLQMNKLKSFL